MQLGNKLGKITGLVSDIGADVHVIGPSSGLEYLTGMNPHPDERFKALFIFKDGRHFYISPEIYYEETRACLGAEEDIFIWSDTDGFLSAIKKANEKYGLDGKIIAVNDGIAAYHMLDIQDIVNAKFINGNSILEDVRVIKSEEEKDFMRKAAKIADKVIEETVKFIRPGLTERDIAEKVKALFLENGTGLSFDSIVASGPNTSRPHYNGDSRVIQEQDIIILDTGCRYNSYCSDISRTVFVGEPTEEQKKILPSVQRQQPQVRKQSKQAFRQNKWIWLHERLLWMQATVNTSSIGQDTELGLQFMKGLILERGISRFSKMACALVLNRAFI